MIKNSAFGTAQQLWYCSVFKYTKMPQSLQVLGIKNVDFFNATNGTLLLLMF